EAKTVTLATGAQNVRGRVMQRSVADAAREAADRMTRAEQAARALLDDAERAARSVRDQARAEGRQQGAAELAAAWIKLRAQENARDERDLDRTVELARAMAERLLGEAIVLDPAKIVSMARQTL